MNATYPHTAALVRQVRNHLWLQAGLALLLRALWLSAGLLLAAGLVHLFAHPLSLELLLLALLPPAAALVSTLLWQRPDPASAAHQADAWCTGRNLIISAWELRQATSPTPTAALVLARAETAAERWREHIRLTHALHWPRQAGLILLLAASGLFLLQLPSKALLSGAADVTERASETNGTPSYSTLQRDQARAAFLAAAQVPERETTKDKSDTAAARPGSRTPGPATPATQDTSHAQDPGMTTRSMQANDGGSRAGEQSGQRRADLHEKANLAVAEQTIARRGAEPGQAGEGTGDIGIAGIAAPLPVVSVVAAAAPGELSYRADLRPALRRYIARYFEELQATP